MLVRNPDRQEATLEAGFTYNPLPRITDISPKFGPTSGGTKLTIRGSGFLQGARVLIGNRPATTEVKDDATLEAVTPPIPQGALEVRAVNPDTQEAFVREGFLAIGEVAYNYPNPFRAQGGTTFRYVTNEPVREMTVRIFNLEGEPVGVAQRANATEVRWVEPDLRIGLYVYLMEVKLDDGQVKRFKRMLQVE
ncbi:IPT/TIG domain-containing protein [Candidatus Poribacteria bacterium]|nr:IPT/TIG domain-containing protein [Candidatus Poribacteria bacterium]